MRAIMNKVYRFLMVAVFAAFFFLGDFAYAGAGSTGKEFFFAFQPNTAAGTANLSLFVTGQQDTQGTVDIVGINFHASFTVQANKVTTVPIPSNAQYLTDNAVSKLAVHVVAQNDITIYGLNSVTYTTDGFLALPIDALGLEYYTLSYRTNYSSYPSQVALVGAYDNTQVTLTPDLAANGHSAGSPFTVTLNRGDTYQVSSVTDITGLHIVASAPVAVMGGVNCTNIPASASACNHIVEMMPPVSAWGKSFLSVPLATRLNGDVFRILASQDNTSITANGVLLATLNKGKYFETVLKNRTQIEASAPILLAQYSPGSSFDGVSADPFMMLIPPTEQFLNQYAFSTPATGFPVNYVNVVVPSGEVGHLLLDGAAINLSLFSPIGSSGFSGGQLPAAVGAHTLSTTSGVPFGIYIYGFFNYDGYGYLGGMSFQAINHIGDPYLPMATLLTINDTLQGTAIDGEDVNSNGIITARSGIENGLPVRDTGVFRIELLADAANLKLTVLPFVPGSLTANFSISRIDQTKPGSGTLHIEDGAGNKYEAPISLGATQSMRNVRVIETLSTADIDIDLTSFTKQPFSITDIVGQKIIEWHFDTFATNAVGDLGFDILFKNPVPSEKRLVSYKVELLYNDINGNPVRTELGSEYVNVHPSIFNITPTTDKLSYAANEVVLITDTVKNLSAMAGITSVRVSIKDANDVLVTLLGTTSAQTIAAGDTGVFTGLNFPTGSTYFGNYKVYAELMDTSGKVIAVGSAPFTVTADNNVGAKTTITSDKQLYAPFDTVRISDRVVNNQINSILNDLRVVTIVNKPDGLNLFTKTEILQQLTPSAFKDYAYTLTLAAAPAGQYTANIAVSTADGTLLTQSSTQFTVSSSADNGSGLSGTLAISPKLVPQGNAVLFSFNANNIGNSTLANLPLTVRIIDPIAQKVMAEFPYTQTLNIGSNFAAANNWGTSGPIGTNYVAVLSAVVGGKTLTLAQDNFTLIPNLFVKQGVSSSGRILVLLSCKNGEGSDGEYKANNEHKDDSKCIDGRVKFISETLTSLGISHLVTTTVDDFRNAFRTGQYNTYWISGGAEKLLDDLAAEIREAVNRGDSLLLDGVHDERNKLLDEVVGVQYRGKLSSRNLPINLAGALFSSGTTATRGQPLKLALGTGTLQAKFPSSLKCGDCSDDKERNGTNSGDNPAIVSNNYGKGHGIVMAFDLFDTLMYAQPLPTTWQTIMGAAFGDLQPIPPNVYTSGALAIAKTNIVNQGQVIDLEVTDTLPTGAKLLSTYPIAIANSIGSEAKWSFNLGAAQNKDVTLALLLPDLAGTYTLNTLVNSIQGGQAKLFGNYPLTFTVASALDPNFTAKLITDLNALIFSDKKERQARDKVVIALQDTLAKTQLTKYDIAIDSLLDAVDGLKDITSKDMSLFRTMMDRWLQELELKWQHTQPVKQTH